MFYSRSCTNLYVLHLIPNKNLLTIDKIKKCSTSKLTSSINRSASIISSRNFRTKTQKSSIPTGLGQNSVDTSNEKSEKRWTFFQLFNPNKDQEEKLKKLLNKNNLNDNEKGQIKVPQSSDLII